MNERYNEYDVEQPERTEAFEGMRSGLDAITRRAEVLGLHVYAAVEVGQTGLRAYKQPYEALFGASLGKLPLAIMAAENLEPEVPLQLDNMHGVESGVTPAELVQRMLKVSDNVSYRILAEVLGGPDEINAFYESKGWSDTRVNTAQNGRAQLAETSPSEVLSQLQYILGPQSGTELSAVARNALSEQQVTNHGIRQLKFDDTNVHVFNKTGEYNGDVQNPFIFRHDAGSIMGPDGRVGYAIMTSISHENHLPTPVKRLLADSTVKLCGAELVTYVGGNLRRSVGAKAVQALFPRY